MKDNYPEFMCIDCGINTLTETGEYYMVRDDVWLAAAEDKNMGMLCIGCLEDRLGRQLNGLDFIDAPINKGVFPQSNRLQLRLAA